jgi:hypothetical protein
MRIVAITQDTVTIELAREDCKHLTAYCECAAGSDPHAGTVAPDVYAALFQLSLKAVEGAEYRDLHEHHHGNQAS